MFPPDSDNYEVDPSLVDAVVYVESTDPKTGIADPNAVSPAGAKGLMQLMDATGEAQMHKQGIEGEYNPFDPDLNRKLGTGELRDQLIGSKGDKALALAKYNYGPGNVAKLQKEYGPSYDDIAAHLPAETQKYVPKVLAKEQELRGESSPSKEAKDYSQYPANGSGFAQALTPVISDPEFDTLSLGEKAAKINEVFTAKGWGPKGYDILKQVMTNYTDAAPEDEKPSLKDVVGAPPMVQSGQNADAIISDWKQKQINQLYKSGISPALFGSSLDSYMKEAGDNERQANEFRNRGVIGEIAAGSYNAALNVTEGLGEAVSKPIGGLVRLSGFEDAGNAVADFPDKLSSLGKPVRDYVYNVDANGYLKQNPDGSLQPKWQTQAEKMVGQIGGLIGGGAELRALGTSAGAINTALFGVNALTLANDSFRSVYDQTGGDTAKSYKAAMFAVPAAFIGTLGQTAVIAKWANPALTELSGFNQAAYLANVITRNALVEGAANAGVDVVSQYGENTQTGKPFDTNRTVVAAGTGAVVGGILSGVHARNDRPLQPPPTGNEDTGGDSDNNGPLEQQRALPAPQERLGLPAPEERKALPGESRGLLSSRYQYGPEQNAAIPLYEPTSEQEQTQVIKALEAFQKSKAAEMVLTPEQAKHIPPEMFSVFQFTPSGDGRTTVLTKIERYLQQDSGTVEGVDTIIDGLKQDLSRAPSPENVQPLMEERAAVKKQLKTQSADLSERMVSAVKERQQYVEALNKAKDTYESQTDATLKKVSKLELREAEGNLQAFDDLHQDVYDAHEKIQPLTDRLDELNSQLKDVLSPTYANDLKAKERNLQGLIKKRQQLAEARSTEAGYEQDRSKTIAAEKERAAQRANALQQAGIEAEPTLDFSNGVRVGDHTVVPIGEKWYAIDRFGEVQGKPHDYYYDAVDSLTQSAENLDRSFVLKNEEDRTALTESDKANVRSDIERANKEGERVAQLKTDTAEKAQEHRAKTYEEETKMAVAKSKKEDAARKTKGQKTYKTSKVTALEEPAATTPPGEVRALAEEDTQQSTGKTSESSGQEKALPLSESRSKTRRYVTEPKKPLTSNYTPLTKFKENSETVVRPQTIIEKAQKVLNSISKNTKIFQGGKVPEGALGFINPLRDYINNARHNDVMTTMHELFHGIDRALIGKWHTDTATPDWSGLPMKVREAAKDMAATYYGRDLQDPDLQIQEGLAMFYQHYSTGQPYRKELGEWYKGQFANENPATFKALESLKDSVFEYYNQTPGAFVRSNITEKANPTAAKAKKYYTLQNLKDQWVDRSSIFTNIDNVTGKVGRIKDYWDANYKRGKAVADSLLQTGAVNANGKVYKTFSLDDAFAPAKGKYDKLEEYLVAQNEKANYYNKGLEGGTNIEDINKVIEAADPDVVRAANNYYKMLDTLHSIVGDSSREGAYYISKLREGNLESTGTEHGYYVPFAREGKGSANPMAKRTGSTRSKIDPIGNISNAFDTMLTKAFQSRVKEQLVDLASGPHASSIGLYMREVTGYERRGLAEKYEQQVQTATGQTPTANEKTLHAFFSEPLDGVSSTDFKTIPYMDGNKLRFFEADPRVINAFKDELPDFINSAWFKFLVRPGSQILRPAATSLRVAFQIKNLIRDPVTAWRYINSGETTPGLSGFKDALLLAKNLTTSITDVALGGKNSQWVQQAGLHYSNRAGASEEVRTQLQQKFGKNFLDFGQNTLNAIERFISVPEQATRLAAMRVEAKRLGVTDLNQKLTPAQELDLLLAYKRSTTNFAIQGASGRVVNLGVPFFTARIAEMSRLPGDFTRNPARFAAYGLGMFTYGLYHALAHSDQEWYQEMTPDAKMNTAWFRLQVSGVEKAIGIPLESEAAMFWGLGQAIGNKMGNDPALPLSYRQLATGYFSMNITPVNSVIDLATPWGKEAIQQYANKDAFTGKSIVPPSLQYANPASQYTEFTSETAKSVGTLTGISPIRIDHAVRATAPAAADALQFMDRALGYKKQKDIQSSNFVVNALSRSGTTSGIADRAQIAFTDSLLEARANKPAESAEEASARKSLEKINKDVSNINTVLTSDALSQEDRDTLRQTKTKILKEGIALAQGTLTGPVTQSGASSQAKAIRKGRSQELKNSTERNKKAVEEGSLSGSSE